MGLTTLSRWEYNSSPSARRISHSRLGEKPHHLADIFRLMNFYFAAQTPGVIFQLALGSIEGIAQGDIDILMVIAVHYDFASRHTDIDAYVEAPP